MSALSMEAFACWDGLRFAIQRGARHIILETDSQMLGDLWGKPMYQRSEISSIINDIGEISGTCLSSELRFVSNICNRVVHTCAKASHSLVRGEWLFEAALPVCDCLNLDCNPATI